MDVSNDRWDTQWLVQWDVLKEDLVIRTVVHEIEKYLVIRDRGRSPHHLVYGSSLSQETIQVLVFLE